MYPSPRGRAGSALSDAQGGLQAVVGRRPSGAGAGSRGFSGALAAVAGRVGSGRHGGRPSADVGPPDRHAASWVASPSSAARIRTTSRATSRIASLPEPFRSSTVALPVAVRNTRVVIFFALPAPLPTPLPFRDARVCSLTASR